MAMRADSMDGSDRNLNPSLQYALRSGCAGSRTGVIRTTKDEKPARSSVSALPRLREIVKTVLLIPSVIWMEVKTKVRATMTVVDARVSSRPLCGESHYLVL